MKKISLFLIIITGILSCKAKSTTETESNTNDSSQSLVTSLKDTIYLKKDSAIVSENIYLYLDSIKSGDAFDDKNNNYGYYRLLFASSEETQSFYIEKILIVGDGIVKLQNRFMIPSKILGFDDFSPNIKFIKWESPEIIEINVGSKKMKLDITKMKVIEITE